MPRICTVCRHSHRYYTEVALVHRELYCHIARHFSVSTRVLQQHRRRFFDAYPVVRRWRDVESGRFDAGARTTRTVRGRRRVDVNRKTQRWNTPIQGSAADALKNIAVNVYEHLDEVPGAELLGLVHDEVLLLVPEEHAEHAKSWLTKMMEGAADEVINHGLPLERRIPMKADTQICRSWGEKA